VVSAVVAVASGVSAAVAVSVVAAQEGISRMADSWEAIVGSLMTDLDQSLAGRYSAVLYGSAARGDWVPGLSDINLLLVLDDTSPASLRGLTQAFSGWRKSGNVPPLVFSREEWAGAADAFPIEVTDILHSYRVLKGSDPVAGMSVLPADLRTLLEHEFLGKLVQLRRGYVALADERAALAQLGTASISTIVLLQRALLALLGRPVPQGIEAVVQEASIAAGAHPGAQLEFVRHRTDQKWMATREQFESYLAAVETAARFVNHLQLGAGS
jgi:hypothetical protein